MEFLSFFVVVVADPTVALTFLEKTREKVFLRSPFLVVHLCEW